jgi:hypothetical protein
MHKVGPAGDSWGSAVLGEKDMGAFQRRWEKDVIDLRFASAP